MNLALITDAARRLQDKLSLEELLQLMVDTSAALLGVERVSIRLLDSGRTRLMAVCRAGAPLHADADRQFTVGEGLVGWVAQHGTPLRVDVAQGDPRFVRRDDAQDRMGSFLGVPLCAGRACLGVLSAVDPAEHRFGDHEEALLTLMAVICAPHVEIARLSRLSQVDPLTGVLNRRGFDLMFPEDAPAPGLPTAPLTLIMVDVDNFKLVNDTHGHAVGDEVLRRVAAMLASVLRRSDAVVRFGGEEFLVVLPATELQRGVTVAERARVAVEHSGVAMDDLTIRVSVSAGVAQRRVGESRQDAIQRADQAMYAAKSAGRNRVVAG